MKTNHTPEEFDRLKAVNAELLAALRMIVVNAGYESGEALPQLRELKVNRSCLDAARAALAKAGAA